MSQRFIASGRLARTPEIRETASGQPVANLRLLQTRGYKKGEQMVEVTEGFDCVTFDDRLITAVIDPWCVKGQRVRIEGRFQTRVYEDEQGVTRYRDEVLLTGLRLLDRATEASEMADAA